MMRRVVLAGAVVLVGAIALAAGAGNQPSTARPAATAFAVAMTSTPPGATASVPQLPSSHPSGDAPTPLPTVSSPPTASASVGPSGAPVPSRTTATNVYAGAGAGMFSAAVAAFPPRVYVPDEAHGTLVVIDPKTYRILSRSNVGASPEHVTPDWDLQRLYVEAAFGGRITVISPATGRPIGRHLISGPYNLYFTVDGLMAIVVIDSRKSGAEYGGQKQLRFYDRRTWHLIKAVDVPHAGADHLDFSADGSFFLLSTEYTGWLVKVDVGSMRIVGSLHVGGNPIDVRLSPDGRVFYVANQGTNGVMIVDAVRLRKLGFLRTGRGAHGLAISRDARRLYVTNRVAGSLSVIDVARRRVIRTWHIGGSPDMIAVSPDGTELWISNRYGGTVSVVDSGTGRVIRIIRVGGRPHGLAYFPEPGRISLGHNGIYR
jgi:YVTN family beta-propeller protein